MGKPITICLTYFQSLGLANLDAALCAVGQQDFSNVESVVVVDNNTADDAVDIQHVLDRHILPVETVLVSCKHGRSDRTHSWSTNFAVALVGTPWVLFTRADYLMCSDLVSTFAQYTHHDCFITANARHLTADVVACEAAGWRQNIRVLDRFPGATVDYAVIDSGVWMLRKETFDRVCGLDEALTAWGHAQTHFQYKLHEVGVEFACVPRVLFYHPQHSAPRDIEVAHAQLRACGVDIRQLWARHTGAQPYGRL